MIGILTSSGEFFIHKPPYGLLRTNDEEIEDYLTTVFDFSLSNITWQVLPLNFEVKKI